MTAKLGRREFLELLCIGGMAQISGCSDVFQERRLQEHGYQMPTLLEVNNTNIASLILDLDYSFGKNGAIPPMRNHNNYEIAKERLETFLDLGDLWVPSNVLNGYSNEDAKILLTQIKTDIHSTMLRYSENPNYGRQDSFCNLLLEMKYDCDTYSTLVLGIAEKYHLPIKGVVIPFHAFTRWITPNAYLNFDQGTIRTDDYQYIDGTYNRNVEPIPPESLNGKSIYLKGLGKKEFVAHYAAGIVLELIANKEYAAALDLADSIKNWSKRDPFTHSARGSALTGLGYFEESKHEFEKALELDPKILE